MSLVGWNAMLINPTIVLKPLRQSFRIEVFRRQMPLIRVDASRLLRAVAAGLEYYSGVSETDDSAWESPRDVYLRPKVGACKGKLQEVTSREEWPQLWRMAAIVTNYIIAEQDIFTLLPQGKEVAAEGGGDDSATPAVARASGSSTSTGTVDERPCKTWDPENYWPPKVVQRWDSHSVPKGPWRSNMALCVGELVSKLINPDDEEDEEEEIRSEHPLTDVVSPVSP